MVSVENQLYRFFAVMYIWLLFLNCNVNVVTQVLGIDR